MGLKAYEPNVAAINLLMPCLDIKKNETCKVLDAISKNKLLLLPVELGTPIAVIEFNQHDGYYIEPKFFSIEHLASWGISCFSTRKEALAQIELNKKEAGYR